MEPAALPKLLLFCFLLILIALDTNAFSASSATSYRNTRSIPVVICPGFGNDEIDYYEPLKQPRDVGLVAALERRGFEVISTVPVKRSDWLRVAGGLLDPGFYTNKARPTGKGYGWYIERFKETVDQAYEKSGGERCLVIGHSAGGWLARAGMGDGVWCAENEVRTADRIQCLTTIGAIHKPPTNLGSCVTRGALCYTDEQFPGAFLREEGVGYVSVGGDAIVGDKSKEQTRNADEIYSVRGEGSSSRVAYTSYDAVCGTGGVTGDGVVPLDWTQLEGSRQLRLEGVLHSINEAGTTMPTDRWYGSEAVIDRWLPAALEEAKRVGSSPSGVASNNIFDMQGLQKWASTLVGAAGNER